MQRYQVKPGEKIRLSEWDPGDKAAFSGGKDEGNLAAVQNSKRLEVLQELLFAEGKHKVLIVLQGMDTCGKDGTIRHVFEGVNPQGTRVASFKVPTATELRQDYLWRVHAQTPGCGDIVIFNRSHYEDVLVVRVHNLVPPEVWGRRYDQIVAFEKMLAEEGTTILKFFLHISPEEQKERLEARLSDPTKRWKFRKGDLAERKLWPEYMQAYEAVLNKTSTEYAPWYIVPSDAKWYRNLVVSSVVVQALEKLKMSYPDPEEDLTGVVVE